MNWPTECLEHLTLFSDSCLFHPYRLGFPSHTSRCIPFALKFHSFLPSLSRSPPSRSLAPHLIVHQHDTFHQSRVINEWMSQMTQRIQTISINECHHIPSSQKCKLRQFNLKTISSTNQQASMTNEADTELPNTMKDLVWLSISQLL